MAIKEQVAQSTLLAGALLLKALLGDLVPVPGTVLITLAVLQAFSLIGAVAQPSTKEEKLSDEPPLATVLASSRAVAATVAQAIHDSFLLYNGMLLIAGLVLFRTFGFWVSIQLSVLAKLLLHSKVLKAFDVKPKAAPAPQRSANARRSIDPYCDEFWQVDLASQEETEEEEGKKALASIAGWEPITAVPSYDH